MHWLQYKCWIYIYVSDKIGLNYLGDCNYIEKIGSDNGNISGISVCGFVLSIGTWGKQDNAISKW